LLQVGIFYNLLASQVLLKEFEEMEITGPNTANWTRDWIWHYSWKVTDNPP
jgi:hypothetical protein